jgi:hypothetical protein
MREYSRGFLEDLARLVSHGPDEIESLISDLSNPDRRNRLIDVLRQISTVASDYGTAKQRTASGRFSYADIRIPESVKTKPDMSEKLEAILKVLTTTASFQSRPVLVDLAERLSVPVVKKDSRARIVQKIIDNLATRDTEQLTRAILDVRNADRGSTESFMGLASFITNGPTDIQ